MSTKTAWDVYSDQLFRLGHGYPLWDPEPTKHGEVLVGDVGFVENGAFYRLFNALRPTTDPVNLQYGVPDGYKPFQQRTDYSEIRRPLDLPPGPLCSRTVKFTSASAQLTVQGAGAGIQFECSDEQGALLVMKEGGNREALHPSRRMANYMRSNYHSWWVFATEHLDLDLQKEDIIFVRGWVKTSEWAVAAFVREGRAAQLTFNGEFGLPASAAFSLSYSRDGQSIPEYNTGPRQRRAGRHRGMITGTPETSTESIFTDGPRFDQCVFLHYYKLKVRFGLWPTVVKAAGGPRDLPSAGDDDANSPGMLVDASDPVSEEVVIEQVPAPQRPYDPLNFVLDYILENSHAEIAIANDNDILVLCQDQGIPDDLKEFLEETQPHIEVNGEGLGMLSLEVITTSEGIAGTHQPSTSRAADPPSEAPQGPPQDIDVPSETKSEGGADKTGRRTGDSPAVILDEHTGGVCALAYSPDGQYIASGSEDATVIIWEAQTGQRLRTCTEHSDTVCSLAFSPDSKELVSGSRDNLVIIWTIATGDARAILEGHRGFIYCVAYSPDGKTVASASVDFTVRTWDTVTGTQRAVAIGHTAIVMLVAFSPDGRRIVSASADYSVRVWDAADCSPVSRLEGHLGVIYSLSFSPDSHRLVTGSDDGTARIWNVETGEELVTLHEHTGSVWVAAFSPDGRRVLSAASDGTVKVCHSFSGDRLLALDAGDSLVNAAAFSPDGSRICASTGDNSVRVWSARTGNALATFTGHTDKVTHLRFSPDGQRIVSSSDDSTLRVWDLRAAWVGEE
ncbi:hypothetical protein AcW2_007006 [Taiwanofungus camphoratus]|nr:hypothetical protein AcW2_007006 [Antrodia cinnamomea]